MSSGFVLALLLVAPLRSPQAIQQSFASVGAAKTLDAVYSDPEAWALLTRGLASGAQPWLDAAVLIIGPADAGGSEELHEGMARALTRAPRAALRAMNQSMEHPRSCCNSFRPSNVCGNTQALASSVAADGQLAWLDQQAHAVKGVSDPELQELRANCLRAIADERAEIHKRERK